METENKFYELGGILLFIVLIPLLVFINVLIFRDLWSWFAVPLFGAPSLNLLESAGVSLLIICATGHGVSFAKQEDDSQRQMINTIVAIIRPGAIWLIGFILHSWV